MTSYLLEQQAFNVDFSEKFSSAMKFISHPFQLLSQTSKVVALGFGQFWQQLYEN